MTIRARTRSRLVALSLALASFTLPAALRAEAPGLIHEDLGRGIHLFRVSSDIEYWTATNTVVVVDENEVTVFDSCTRASTARAVIAEIRKLTPNPVRTLINSHWHMDHWSGNDEFARAFPGLRIVASETTRDYMARMGKRFFLDEVGADRARARVEEAIRTGKTADGKPLTDEIRKQKEASLADVERFAAELEATPRVLPNVVYGDRMTFWVGAREFRLLEMTGDATGSTVLYLPGDRLLVTGDVLISPEGGNGPPPWTTNSYAITPWLASLRSLAALDVERIVPGQGPLMNGKSYLELTVELFAAVIDQVHAALARDLVTLTEVQGAVNVDAIGVRYTPGATAPSENFRPMVGNLVKKSFQEALDGAASLR